MYHNLDFQSKDFENARFDRKGNRNATKNKDLKTNDNDKTNIIFPIIPRKGMVLPYYMKVQRFFV